MATTMLQKGLLGYDPMELRAQEQKQWATLYGQAGSPYEKMGIALGQLGGALFGGESPAASKANIINEALNKAGQQYQQGTAEYYKAVADALPTDDPMFSDSREFATQKYLETKKNETTAYTDAVKAIKDNPELLPTFTDPLKISLLQKATKNGWNEAETPMPQTQDEIKSFAKQFGLEKDPMYRQLISMTMVADKEAKKEAVKVEHEALTMKSIQSTINRNNAELGKIRDDKFEAGNRWNQERESAIALFKANNLDPAVPLKGINLANTELVNAQRIALRNAWTGKATEQITPPGGGANPPSKPAQPTTTPIPLPALRSQAVVGQVYITEKGPMQWDGGKFNPVAK
jgi:hypothetical protein